MIGDQKVSKEPILVKTYKDGSKKYRVDACPKCGGIGYLHGYEHIDGARCWKCGATGYFPHEYIEASEERIERQQEKNKSKLIDMAEKKNSEFFRYNGFNDKGKSYIVLGNTYDIRDELKSLGGKFDYVSGWKIPNDTEKYDTIEIDVSDVAETNDVGWYVFKPVGEIEEVINKKKKEFNDKKKAANPEEAQKESEYLGTIGGKITVKAKLVKTYTYTASYGYRTEIDTTVFTFRDDDNNKIVWKTGTPVDVEENKTYEITGTVKDHKEYRGEKETVLVRCKLKEIK